MMKNSEPRIYKFIATPPPAHKPKSTFNSQPPLTHNNHHHRPRTACAVESVTQLPANWIVFQNNKMSINKQPIIHFTEEAATLSW